MINCKIGDLRHRVSIDLPIRTPNELGEQEISWSELKKVWARVSPLSSREQMYAKQAQSRVTHRVQMRWLAGLTTDCRLRWQDADGTQRILGIAGLTNVEERNIEWDAQCIEQRQSLPHAIVSAVGVSDDTHIGVEFTLALDTSSLPGPGTFQVTDDSGTVAANSVAVSGSTLTFGFPRAISNNDVVPGWAINDPGAYRFTSLATLAEPFSGVVSFE